ncbi:UNKNOWN [Stylonychia lemnae]|uniref:Uncharacterized protein n=1 Tax=Stylonychia lemnae TaxID=5949 RepID=A0A078AV47_STYLE|nr:UNKNOWN [Stylonychia lemnae]|eukprot:CDW86079.1 UNKNOWN [Stylonychia lemnae]
MDKWTLADLRDEVMDYILEKDITANAIYNNSEWPSIEIDGKFYTDEQIKSTPIKGLIHNLTAFKLHADYGIAGGSDFYEEGGCCSLQ